MVLIEKQLWECPSNDHRRSEGLSKLLCVSSADRPRQDALDMNPTKKQKRLLNGLPLPLHSNVGCFLNIPELARFKRTCKTLLAQFKDAHALCIANCFCDDSMLGMETVLGLSRLVDLTNVRELVLAEYLDESALAFLMARTRKLEKIVCRVPSPRGDDTPLSEVHNIVYDFSESSATTLLVQGEDDQVLVLPPRALQHLVVFNWKVLRRPEVSEHDWETIQSDWCALLECRNLRRVECLLLSAPYFSLVEFVQAAPHSLELDFRVDFTDCEAHEICGPDTVLETLGRHPGLHYLEFTLSLSDVASFVDEHRNVPVNKLNILRNCDPRRSDEARSADEAAELADMAQLARRTDLKSLNIEMSRFCQLSVAPIALIWPHLTHLELKHTRCYWFALFKHTPCLKWLCILQVKHTCRSGCSSFQPQNISLPCLQEALLSADTDLIERIDAPSLMTLTLFGASEIITKLPPSVRHLHVYMQRPRLWDIAKLVRENTLQRLFLWCRDYIAKPFVGTTEVPATVFPETIAFFNQALARACSKERLRFVHMVPSEHLNALPKRVREIVWCEKSDFDELPDTLPSDPDELEADIREIESLQGPLVQQPDTEPSDLDDTEYADVEFATRDADILEVETLQARLNQQQCSKTTESNV